MSVDYSLFRFHKGRPAVLVKRANKAAASAEERTCRKLVDQRDGRRCRYPGCREKASQKHHIVKRSQIGEWSTSNICSLCQQCHQLVHVGLIHVSGNADRVLTWTTSPTLKRAARNKVAI